MKTRAFKVTLLVLGLSGLTVAAEEAEATDEKDQVKQEYTRSEMEEYVEVNDSYIPTSDSISTKLPVPLQETPFNVGVVSGTLYREQNAQFLGDTLLNVSGVNVQSQSGIADYVVVRGFDSLSSALVMTDGAPEPEASFYSTYNVEGVEVLKGPGGFLYGAYPLAGTINMVRKQPIPTSFLSVGGMAGSFGSYEGTLDWNTTNGDGDVSFRLNGIWRESDSYRAGKPNDQLAINPGLAWQINENSTLNFNLEYVESNFTPDAGIPLFNGEIPGVDRETNYQVPDDFSEQEINRFQVDYENKLSDKVTLRDKFYYRSLDWQSNGTILLDVFDPGFGLGPQVLRTMSLLDSEQQWIGNQLEAVLNTSTGSVEHQLLFGLEFAELTDDYNIDVVPPEGAIPQFPGVPTIDLIDPQESFGGIQATIPLQGGTPESRVIAPYVIDQMKFSGRFQLLLGLRYDNIDYKDRGRTVNGFPLPVDRDDSELSPMAGLVYTPGAQLTLYANAARSHAPASPRLIGDLASFDPEQSTQFEIGVKKKFLNGKLQTTFALYELERENIGISDSTGFTQQAGDQRSRGFEIDFAAEPAPRLRTFLSFAYNDSELTSFVIDEPGQPLLDLSGNDPAFAPRELLSLWVSKSFAKSNLSVAGGLRYVGDQYINEFNSFRIDAYTVLGAAIYYDFKDVRLKLNVENLTDEEYETRAFPSNAVVPAPDRAYYLGFEFRM